MVCLCIVCDGWHARRRVVSEEGGQEDESEAGQCEGEGGKEGADASAKEEGTEEEEEGKEEEGGEEKDGEDEEAEGVELEETEVVEEEGQEIVAACQT